MTTEKEPSSLLEAIEQISALSYEVLILKYPFLNDYLKKHKDPKIELTLWMTAAGAGYVLVTKEEYVGEHDEIIQSIQAVDGLQGFVENFTNIMMGIKDNEKQRTLALPAWVISRLKNGKPTKEDINGPGIDIAQILDLCIRDYETKKSVEG